MKEAITALSKQQNIILQKLFNHLHIDSLTANKTQKYYRELRRLTTNSNQQPIPLDNIMKAAILIAQQSQELYNLKGQKICGVHLALNQIIRSTNNFKGVVNALKIYLNFSKSIEFQLREDVIRLIDQLTFGNNFVAKFKKTIDYFDFVQVQEHFNYRNLFQSFSWLLFINMHSQIPINNHTEVDYLLISVLYLMVRYAYPYLRPRKMAQIHNNKALIASIIEQLFSIFIIEDPASFKKINSEVDSEFQQLISSEIIKCRFQYDFISPSLIRNNYKKLDALYQRKRVANSVDLRMFLANRLETLTPVKQSRVSPNNIKQKMQNKKQSFASHKILNFQNETENKLSVQMNLKQIKLPLNVRVSPSYIKTPLLCANRVSPTMPIQLFMAKTVKNNKYRLESLDNQSQVLSVIELILKQLNFTQSVIQEKKNAVFNYYIVLQTKFLNQQDYQDEDLNGIYCSSLVHALLFVAALKRSNEQEIQSFIRTTLNKITKQIQVSEHHLWMLSKFMVKQVIQYPPILKQLLYSLEFMCINQYIWRETSIHHIQKYFITQTQRHFLFTQLVQRIKKQVKNMISRLSATAIFNSFQTLIENQVFNCMIYTIINYPDIMLNRHLHQIFLSTCYRVLKSQQPQIRFNDLIQQHQLVNNISNQQLKYIICRVKLCNAEQQTNQVNIIQFYNKCYLSFAKTLPSHFDSIYNNLQHFQAETSEKKSRFSMISKGHNSKSKLGLSNRFNSQQSSKAQTFHNNIQNSEFQADQIQKQLQKPVKQKKLINLEDEARDETKQRQRRAGVNWHWQQTEKGKNVNYLR